MYMYIFIYNTALLLEGMNPRGPSAVISISSVKNLSVTGRLAHSLIMGSVGPNVPGYRYNPTEIVLRLQRVRVVFTIL